MPRMIIMRGVLANWMILDQYGDSMDWFYHMHDQAQLSHSIYP